MTAKRLGLAGALLIIVFGCCAAKDPVVSVILSSDMVYYKDVAGAFKMYFADKGTSISINEYSLKAQGEAEIVSGISSEKPDLLLTVGEGALKTAKEQLKGIPTVFVMVFDAKTMIDDNTTGILLDISPEMKLSGIKKILPGAKTIGMLYSPASTASYDEFKAECDKRGITLKAKIVNADAEFTGALNSVFAGSDCFLVILDPKLYFSQTLKFLLLESLKQKVPVIGLSSFYTKAGAVASFECDYKDLGRQAGEISAKILGGEKASVNKPVHPRKFRYSLNLMTAERIGVTIPGGVINEAAEVIDK